MHNLVDLWYNLYLLNKRILFIFFLYLLNEQLLGIPQDDKPALC